MVAALNELPKLENLRTLVLKAFDLKSLNALLSTKVGYRLSRLDLHYNNNYPGVNLADIAVYCPYLSELAVCDSLITTDYKTMAKSSRFKFLISLKLLRVAYSNQQDWECLPR